MKIGRYEVPSQIADIVSRARAGQTHGVSSVEKNGISYLSYICDANLMHSHAVKGTGHCVWLAINPTVRRLRVHLKARYRNGCIAWAASRSIKVLVGESGLVIRDGVMETARNSRECRYGEWSQYFECKSSGMEGIITQCSEQEMEAHFSILCSQSPVGREPSVKTPGELPVTTKSVFLSHASEDKDQIVRPFAEALRVRSVQYWLDEGEIAWGDNVVAKINQGLATSTFVVCFLSSSFAGRNWTIAELSSALGAQMNDGVKRVLPIIVGEPEAVLAKIPLLRGYSYRVWDPGKQDALATELKTLLDR
jgi:hypothetical protein